MILDHRTILLTGGTGTFGRAFVKRALQEDIHKVIVFSRDELKQFEMRQETDDDRLQFFLGDVRDRDRLMRAFDGVDFVIHAAALKQVPALEYNPREAILTNVMGASNVIDAAIDRSVKKVVAVSTDKAVNPVNLYGATKLAMEKLLIAGNSYSGSKPTKFSLVRYGNVAGSRGSVVPYFKQLASNGHPFKITDERMTRFWLTIEEGVDLVIKALEEMKGGEIFVPKIPSMRVIDLAKAIDPNREIEIVGIRPGEKLHEVLISDSENRLTLEYKDHYVVKPAFHWWRPDNGNGGQTVSDGFKYSSDANPRFLNCEQLREAVCRM